jgi:hypothetical protein
MTVGTKENGEGGLKVRIYHISPLSVYEMGFTIAPVFPQPDKFAVSVRHKTILFAISGLQLAISCLLKADS